MLKKYIIKKGFLAGAWCVVALGCYLRSGGFCFG